MSRRWTVLIVLLAIALPSLLAARWIKDKVFLETESVGKVVFSHYDHMAMESVGRNCQVCHNDLFHVVAKKNPTVTMAEMATGKSCGKCHNGKQAFNVTGDCTTCHAGDLEIVYGDGGKVRFSHEIHADMFGCDDCHPDLFVAEINQTQVGMAAMEDGESCGACHDGSSAFSVAGDCGTCHISAANLTMGSPVGGVFFSHEIHSDMFGCDDCHPDIFKPRAGSNQVGMQAMEQGESCGACHDGDTAFGVKGDCVTCHTGAAELQIDVPGIGTAPFSHAIHADMFGCDECHPDLFKAQANSNRVGMKAMEKGASCGACHDGSSAFSVAGDCGTCHISAANLTMGSPVGGVFFSHEIHSDMFGCDDCHPDIFKPRAGSNQVGMQAMEQGESCGACHDGDTAFGVKGDCVTCHTGAAELQIDVPGIGTAPFSHAIHADMFGCDECHPDLFKAQANSNRVGMKAMEKGASCGACHDGGSAFSVKGDCAACHPGAVELNMATDGFGPVPFSHEVHTGMFGCGECHPDVFKAQAGSNRVGMQAMEKGASCGACHDGGGAFSVKGDCVACHPGAAEMKMATTNVGLVPFSHDVHLGMFSCGECHPDIFRAQANSNRVGMQAMEQGASCGACHDGSSAFGVKDDCTACHAGDILYQEEDAGDVVFPHAAHLGMFGCDDCHPALFQARKGANKASMADMENGLSCGACHDGSSAFGVAEDCEACHAM
ncbi:MAG: cytochrome c3 family protein [Desulfuromonadales bacterium]|nr:cytochrome c3 family protein [Desulfuromonadales bacterium]